MADSEQHRAKLQQLNRNFIRSVEEADVARFDANLAHDFFNTNSDGSFIDRKAFSRRAHGAHRSRTSASMRC
jgi:hypothetical protein